jgi:hypothetical protein
MRIRIEEAIFANKNILVCFSSDFGNAIAHWNGEKPIVNEEYQVEVDISETLEWEKDVEFEKDGKDSIHLKNQGAFISGCVDSIDEDGYAVLRLGGNIIPFSAKGKSFPIGARVKLSVKTIALSPVDY